MLEEIFGLRQARPLPDQLGAEKLDERAVEVVSPAEGPERRVVEKPTNDGGMLEYTLRRSRQPVDPGCDNAAQRVRDREACRLDVGDPAIALAPEHVLLDERPDDLLHEERVALRS